jgi:4-hydroxybenzoate polyprenyltransferase
VAQETADLSPDSAPLFVDLDGTLIRVDTVEETFVAAFFRRPWSALLCLFWLLRGSRGRARFKSEITKLHMLDCQTMPYEQAVVDYLAGESARGRAIILATGANEAIAQRVAAHLGLFTGILSSDPDRNLVGREKARAIRSYAGSDRFAYAGNSRADCDVWENAAEAILVNAKASYLERLEKAGKTVWVISLRRAILWRELIEAARCYQWVKNGLIFVPILLAHRFLDWKTVLAAARGALAFSFLASSLYIVNDLADLEADRHHPRKRNRIFARGALSARAGILYSLTLLAMTAALAITLSPLARLLLVLYAVVALSYSFKLKTILFMDVTVLASFYTLRIFFGAAVTNISISVWTLAFAIFLFLSLALVKRQTEVAAFLRKEAPSKSNRGYLTEDLPQIGSLAAASAYLSVLVLALYINSPEVRVLYSRPDLLWAICPLLVYW